MNTRTALVTGANRGLGLETCRQLARQGLRVILTSRREADGALAQESLAREGLTVESHPLDVANPSSITTLAQALGRKKVAIDVLVNNAGVFLHDFNVKALRQTLEINLSGPMRVTDGLLPLLSEGGSIVMVSSGLGALSGFPPAIRDRFLAPQLTRAELTGMMVELVNAVERGRHAKSGWPASAYNISKAALNALVRVLARELGPRARVNAVSPGWARTDMGGEGAPRSVEDGAASIVAAAMLDDGTTGGNYQDGKAIPW